jgi:hypothetical protein
MNKKQLYSIDNVLMMNTHYGEVSSPHGCNIHWLRSVASKYPNRIFYILDWAYDHGYEKEAGLLCQDPGVDLFADPFYNGFKHSLSHGYVEAVRRMLKDPRLNPKRYPDGKCSAGCFNNINSSNRNGFCL